jgi:CPA2 family monovalent cation:H+ antiporter-2
MLLSLKFVVGNWSTVVLAVVVILVIKFGVCFSVARLFRQSGRTALLVGAGLAQIGEFSFILAQAGIDSGIISDYFYSIVIASSVITMLLTPLLMALVSMAYPKLAKGPAKGKLVPMDSLDPDEAEFRRSISKVVLCGYGRVGRNIAQRLYSLGIPYLVIEMDPELVSELHRKGENCIYGDASNAHVLSLARLEKARVLIVTYPDPLTVVTTVKNALNINAKIKIVARVHRRSDSKILEKLGVSDLISPEYEASFEFLHRTLEHIGWGKVDIQKTIGRFRHNEQSPQG